MESIKTCQICFIDYDIKNNAPRCLPCGHIICPKCLKKILNDPNLRKCPFDKIAFLPFQKSLLHFPVSYAIREMLEQGKSNTCKAHPDELIEFFCLTDETKICFDCTQDEHQGHKIKKIKTLKAQGAKFKEELQDAVMNVATYEQEKDDNFEQIRKVFISAIDEQVKEVKNILVEKQFEWVQQVNNIFSANKKHDSDGFCAFKQQMDETIEDITHAYQDEDGDLALLNRETQHGQSIAQRHTQFLEEKSLNVQNKVLEMKQSLKEALLNSQRAINSLQLSTRDVVKEIYSVQEDGGKLTQEELAERHKKLSAVKFLSPYAIEIDSGCLKISFERSQPKELEINLADFEEIEKVDIQLIRCNMLENESHPDVLSYIFHGTKKLVNLRVSFDPENFSNESLLWLGNKVQSHVHHLEKIRLDLEKCKFDDESMSILCDMIVSKAINLNSFALDVESCQIFDEDIKLLVRVLELVGQQLVYFWVVLIDDTFTNDGIYRIFETIKSMEALKELYLSLSSSHIENQSFEMFGENTLSSLKNLENLFLSFNSHAFSDEALCTILKNLPDLKSLKLYLYNAPLTDEPVEMLIGEVLPRLESLKCFHFEAEGTNISSESMEKIEVISESLKEKRGNDEEDGCGSDGDAGEDPDEEEDEDAGEYFDDKGESSNGEDEIFHL